MLLANQYIQKALFERLQTSGIENIFDSMPDEDTLEGGAVYPFVVMSDHTAAPWDTDDSEGLDIVFTIDFWSRYAGNSEVKGMMQQAYNVLHRHELQFDDTTLHCVQLFLQNDQVLIDTDGVTRHGILEIRMLVDSSVDVS